MDVNQALNKLRIQRRSRQAQAKIAMQRDRAKRRADIAKSVRQRAVERSRDRARRASIRAKQSSRRATARARARQRGL